MSLSLYFQDGFIRFFPYFYSRCQLAMLITTCVQNSIVWDGTPFGVVHIPDIRLLKTIGRTSTDISDGYDYP